MAEHQLPKLRMWVFALAHRYAAPASPKAPTVGSSISTIHGGHTHHPLHNVVTNSEYWFEKE